MTRLTNRDRDLIRASILADLPAPVQESHIMAACVKVAVASLPPTAKRLWEDAAQRGLLKTNSVYPNYDAANHNYIAQTRVPGFEDATTQIVRKDPEVQRLCKAYTDQLDARASLDRQLTANFSNVITRDEFTKRFPELMGYLPELTKVTPEVYLPATTALIDGLRGAGLPIPKVAKAA